MERFPAPGRRLAPVALVLASAVLALAGCTAAAPAATPSPVPSTAPGASTAPAGTAEAAFAAIHARTPWFDGVKAKDLGAIGQASWWEATGTADGWTVTITVGWGDCQAGCINKHAWTWHVAKDGTVAFTSQTGAALSDDQEAKLAADATTAGVGGTVTSGPSCPVQRVGDTSCDARPVAGAVLAVRSSAGGAEVARVTTDGSGFYRLALAPGDYTLEPQKVDGLMGTAPASKFTVQAGKLSIVPVSYDTGIR